MAGFRMKEEPDGDWYWDETLKSWIHERWVCRQCLEDGKVVEAEERYSFGIYAGKYCDKHWRTSGYRDATDPYATFDEADAGERMEPL